MIFLLICVLIGVSTACIQNYFCKNLNKVLSDNLLYQLIIYSVGAFAALFTVKLQAPSGFTVAMSVVAGLLIMTETYCILQAMRCGPMSLTSMFTMAALLIPVCLSPVLWKEKLTVLQIIGTVLVVISMVLILDVPSEIRNLRVSGSNGKTAAGSDAETAESSNGKTAAGSDTKAAGSSGITRKWLLYAIGAFLLGGCCAIPEKYLVNSAYAGESGLYVILSFLTVSILSAAALLIRRSGMKEQPTFRITGKRVPLFLFLGVANAVSLLLIIEALKQLPASVVYCTHNGGRLVLITVMDILLFRQKLKPIQIIGMAAGLASIVCLSL